MRVLRRAGARSRAEGKKGIALLMALIMVVLMTAYISEFNYSARARILSAAHARDDMRALYLARSGVRVYMLLLSFGNQIAGNQFVQGMLAQVGLNLDGATMICKDLPFFDTAMLRFLVGAESMNSDEKEEGLLEMVGLGGGDGEAAPAPRGTEVNALGFEDTPTLRRGLLDFEGDFKVECSDETAKIDLNGLAEPTFFTVPLQQHPVALMLFGQMSPEEYDPLFEERLKIDRWELIANIKDYLDPDEQRSHTFGGDESRQYDDFEPRYKPKDRLLDTVQEVRMVAGVTDEVFSTFGPGWSVHNRSYQVNVNTASPDIIRALIRAVADPSFVSDTMIDARMPSLMVERMIIPFTDANQFMSRIAQPSMAGGSGPQVPGIPVNPDTTVTDRIKKLIRTKSNVFRMTSTGYIGDSARTMDVTIRMRRTSPRWLDWRER